MTAAHPLPFEFSGVVRLTKIGTTYVVSTIVVAIAAINTGNNALYIAVAFMLGALLLSGLASKGGLKHLELEIGGIDEAWAGRPAGGVLRVRNGSKIWNVRDVVLTSESLASPVLLPVVPRGAEIVVHASFLFRRRGLASVSAIDSYTRYPFGFFLKKRRLRVSSEAVVYPRILDDVVAVEQSRAIEGELRPTNRIGIGSEIHSFRDFRRGDSLRHVHWKKSASIGRWIMKQTEADATEAVHVFVDPFKPPRSSEEEFEEMISAATTFVLQATRRELDVTVSVPRVTVRARPTESPAPLFRLLALVEAEHEPVWQPVDDHAVVFSLAGGRNDAKSA